MVIYVFINELMCMYLAIYVFINQSYVFGYLCITNQLIYIDVKKCILMCFFYLCVCVSFLFLLEGKEKKGGVLCYVSDMCSLACVCRGLELLPAGFDNTSSFFKVPTYLVT